jgi:hypothetical protein
MLIYCKLYSVVFSPDQHFYFCQVWAMPLFGYDQSLTWPLQSQPSIYIPSLFPYNMTLLWPLAICHITCFCYGKGVSSPYMDFGGWNDARLND